MGSFLSLDSNPNQTHTMIEPSEITRLLTALEYLRFLPQEERSEAYDTQIAPGLESAAADVRRNPDAATVGQWLKLQAAAVGLAVEEVSEVTSELQSAHPDVLAAAAADLADGPRQRLELLLSELRGEETLPAEMAARADEREQLVAEGVAPGGGGAQPAANIFGEFVRQRTNTSSRGFPIEQGRLRIFAADGSLAGDFLCNSGGGASSFRRTNGPVPPGTYRISNHRPNRTTAGMVLSGVGYSFDVDPTGGTDVFGRSLFRIHPDGNNEGTNGCLGVRESVADLRSCERAIVRLLEGIGAFKIVVGR
jgi:hypothetical protein